MLYLPSTTTVGTRTKVGRQSPLMSRRQAVQALGPVVPDLRTTDASTSSHPRWGRNAKSG
jgi:hypothetical protein